MLSLYNIEFTVQMEPQKSAGKAKDSGEHCKLGSWALRRKNRCESGGHTGLKSRTLPQKKSPL